MDDPERLRQAARLCELESKQRDGSLDADETAELEALQAASQAFLQRDLEELTARVNAWRRSQGYSPVPHLGPLAPLAQNGPRVPPRLRLVYSRRDARARRDLPASTPGEPPPQKKSDA